MPGQDSAGESVAVGEGGEGPSAGGRTAASAKDRGGDAGAYEDGEDDETFPPPAVGYPGVGSEFNFGAVDLGRKALNLDAPPIECEARPSGPGGLESRDGSPRRLARPVDKTAPATPFRPGGERNRSAIPRPRHHYQCGDSLGKAAYGVEHGVGGGQTRARRTRRERVLEASISQ